MRHTIKIQLGPKLFEFETFIRWVNKAKGWFTTCGVPSHQTVCIDAIGRICTSGKEFARARDENTFPVAVYAIDPILIPIDIDYESAPEKSKAEIEIEKLLKGLPNG